MYKRQETVISGSNRGFSWTQYQWNMAELQLLNVLWHASPWLTSWPRILSEIWTRCGPEGLVFQNWNIQNPTDTHDGSITARNQVELQARWDKWRQQQSIARNRQSFKFSVFPIGKGKKHLTYCPHISEAGPFRQQMRGRFLRATELRAPPHILRVLMYFSNVRSTGACVQMLMWPQPHPGNCCWDPEMKVGSVCEALRLQDVATGGNRRPKSGVLHSYSLPLSRLEARRGL